jgi:hypothetical protein
MKSILTNLPLENPISKQATNGDGIEKHPSSSPESIEQFTTAFVSIMNEPLSANKEINIETL